MANYSSDVSKLVARCRRIGWDVEPAPGDRGTDWSFRITCPDGKKIQIHRTPRDPATAIENKYRELDAHGFTEAEQAWIADNKNTKAARLRAERARAEAEAQRIAAREQARHDAIVKAAGPLAGPQPVDPAWLTTPTKIRESKVVLMNGTVARMVLDTMNKRNRRPSQSRVSYFENLINDGEFGCTHQGGAIDWDGNLQDGQSRLQAIANLDVEVEMEWTVGLDPAHFSRVDTGGLRTGRDTAYIMGEEDPRTSTAAARMLLMIDRHGPDANVKAGKGRVSNDTIGKCIERYGDPLRQAIRLAKEIRKDVRKANAAALACGIYLIRQRLPEGDARVALFFEQLRDGNIDKADVVWKLRQALLNGTGNRAYDQWSALALIIKAWNYRHTNRRVVMLTWKAGIETFPCHVFLPAPPMSQAVDAGDAGGTDPSDRRAA